MTKGARSKYRPVQRLPCYRIPSWQQMPGDSRPSRACLHRNSICCSQGWRGRTLRRRGRCSPRGLESAQSGRGVVLPANAGGWMSPGQSPRRDCSLPPSGQARRTRPPPGFRRRHACTPGRRPRRNDARWNGAADGRHDFVPPMAGRNGAAYWQHSRTGLRSQAGRGGAVSRYPAGAVPRRAAAGSGGGHGAVQGRHGVWCLQLQARYMVPAKAGTVSCRALPSGAVIRAAFPGGQCRICFSASGFWQGRRGSPAGGAKPCLLLEACAAGQNRAANWRHRIGRRERCR